MKIATDVEPKKRTIMYYRWSLALTGKLGDLHIAQNNPQGPRWS
jgi:hypothetical protein